MSRAQDILIAGLAIATGVLGVVAWRQHVALRNPAGAARHDARALPAMAMTLHSAATRTLAVTPRPSSGGALRNGIDDPRENGDGYARPEPTAKPSRRRGAALARLMEDPDFVQALTLRRHSMLDARFAELFRRLNLQGGELAAFKRLLAEKENVALDVVTVSEASPAGPLTPELLRASVHAAQSQIEQAIHNSLGSDRYAVYRDYERTLAQRATVTQLEQRLSYTATPLTPAQAESVVRILASNTPAAPAETPAPPVSVLVRAAVPEAVPIQPTSAATGRVTEEVIAQVQTVLAPPQVEALREIQVEQQAAIRAAQMIRDVSPTAAELLPVWPALLLH